MSSSRFNATRLSSIEAIQHFKPVSKNKSKSKKTAKSASSFKLNGHSSPNCLNQILDNFENIFNSIQDEIYCQLLDQLVNFVLNKCLAIKNEEPSVASKYIPTAVVNMGFGTAYLAYIQTLIERLNEICSNVILISSSNIESVFDFLLILQNNLFENVDDGPAQFYSLLAKCYKETSDEIEPVILIFKDFEELDSSIMAKLIPVMFENLDKLPIILICCQTIDIVSIQTQLPARATDCLLLEYFSCTHYNFYFQKLLEEISFKSKALFKLGPNIISLFIDSFVHWNSSIENIFKIVKLCIFEHTYNRSYTRVCSFHDFKKELESLTKEEIKAIRNLPSLKALECPASEPEFLRFLESSTQDFLNDYKTMILELKCYDALREYFSQDFNVGFLKGTFIPFLSLSNFYESRPYLNLCESIREMTIEKIPKLMSFFSNDFQEAEIAKNLLKHFEGFEEKISENSLDKKKEVESIKKRLASRNRSDFRDKLKMMATSGQGQKKKIDVWKNEFVIILEKGLKRIRNPFKSAFHEMFCFDDKSVLSRYTYPCPRNDILDALSQPQIALKCKCCSDFNPDSPTISIVYNLFIDSSRIINLKASYDNYKAFITSDQNVINPKKAKKKSNVETEQEILSKFISAVQDLEYIGFIRTHPSKSDHVFRLVWK